MEYSRKQTFTLAGVCAFAGMLGGLLGPIFFFSSRLAVQESRSAFIESALTDIRVELREFRAEVETGQLTSLRGKQP